MKVLIILLAALNCFSGVGLSQQPQSQTAPIYSANAKYSNGVAPGYAPTFPMTGLNLLIGPGSSHCTSSGEEYAGGTLAMTASSTNYVYLDSASSCVLAKNTTGWGSIPGTPANRKVTPSSSAITAIDDVRSGSPDRGGSTGGMSGGGLDHESQHDRANTIQPTQPEHGRSRLRTLPPASMGSTFWLKWDRVGYLTADDSHNVILSLGRTTANINGSGTFTSAA
jgi:hypothetical protein